MSNLQDMAAAPKMVYYARRSRELGKMASHFTGNEAANILAEKTAMDTQVFSLLEKTADRLMTTFEALKKVPGLPTVAKGLGYGIGAAVPLGLAGQYLVNDAADQAKSVVYPAAGVLGAGAGLMALSNMVGDNHDASSHGNRKQASDDMVKTGMAAYAVADGLRNVLATTKDPGMRKLAQDTLQVALAHVADIVGDIVL